MLKVAVVGATGYTGEELVKILLAHPKVKVASLTAKIDKPQRISEIFPGMAKRTDLICELPDEQKVATMSEMVFLALPHKVSMHVAPKFTAQGKKVIDLSADYRLPADSYEKWYGKGHSDKPGIEQAIYGLPELFREKIKKAALIANPGCYPTSIVLGLLPLAKQGSIDTDLIIADSKTGVTGAGRKADLSLNYSEINESIKAYKVNEHQHSPEIDLILSGAMKKEARIMFVPHLVPMNRGILSTIYVKLNEAISSEAAVDMYKAFYKDEPFVEILDKGCLPQIKDVRGTNFCHIGIKADESRKMCIIVSAIDNLIKGAAGQAVQNMNIMCGFAEEEGLT
ncbi:MAG: N-acetyl-gamma-glutamyl-phosphate reductase [Candidatus Omnitrophota bacterium]